MEQIRAFIAIELPEELRLALKQLQQNLQQGKQSGAKWVDPQGIHLTLKFLGDIGTGRVSDIVRVMEQSVQGISPFGLEAKDVGAFPNLRRPRVVWVGISGEVDQLNRMQQRIETGLIPLGFAAEARPFSPHLTLARLRNTASPEEIQRIGQLISGAKFERQSIRVGAVNLMRSELTREGAIYSRISSVELTPY